VFGFSACPYLDLTFHRARQSTASPRASFGIGFGVLFLLMIVYSLIYSRAFALHAITTRIAIFLFVHMAVQSAFTIAAHARELHNGGGTPILIIASLTLVSWLAYWFLPNTGLIHKLRAGEIIYRIFMGFYGLVFPAYVWLIMMPSRGRRGVPTHWNLLVYTVSVLIAAPMFFLGFVKQEMMWLGPGLGIVLIARLLIRQPQQNSAPI
jgi:hypothetical protein